LKGDATARWEADWLMAFHPDKCTILTITRKKTPFKHDYILHNHILEPVTSAKYLGVTVKYLRDLFPFEVILSMWVFHLRLDCTVTPRYFAEVNFS
jgi:hypothetical protein